MSAYKDYGYSTDHENHVSSYILDPLFGILNENKQRTILDLGCGNGWLVDILLKNNFTTFGTDASETGIEIAKRKHPDHFFLQDLSKDDLPQELQSIGFDTILSTEVIEHLYSPRTYVQFCKKILLQRGGGELIITTPYHGYFKNVMLSVTGKMNKHFTVLWDGGHIKFWSRETLSSLLTEAGFRVTNFIGCGRLPYLWKSMMIRAKIGKAV